MASILKYALGIFAAGLVCMRLLAGLAHAERIRVFSEPNYQGWNSVLLGNQPSLEDDGRTHRIQSVHVISGSWLLCEQTASAGDCVWVDHDLPSLSAVGFDKPVLSARPERVVLARYRWAGKIPPRHSIVLFAENNYAGNWIAVANSEPEVGDDIRKLRARSIVVQDGVWQICSDAEFSGRCLTLTGDAWDLRSIYLGPIQSIRRIDAVVAQTEKPQ